MQQLDLVQAKIDISELAAKYCHACDHTAWDDVVDLYTEDGVFDAEAVYGKVYTGKDELRGFYENAPDAVAHHPAGLFSDVHDEGSATALCKLVVFFRRQVFSVDYSWELVKVGAEWKISKQTIEVIGKAKLAADSAPA